ncbi:MAG: sigma 54-interacting transcriptional regulator [Deltaproteobacteria bacterium]|nr:sigma 54-interacting transcriptional regulator [Deltaproteobacteria bacterium]
MPTGTNRTWDERSDLRLLVVSGSNATSHALSEGTRLVIGRSADANVVVDHAAVSARHAQVLVRDGEVLLEDLGSRHGTRLRGEKLAPGHRAPMCPGETAVLGGVVIVLQAPTTTHGRHAGTRPPSVEPTDGPMEAVNELVELVAAAPVAVLLLGETGVGKTTVAEKLHARSGRTGQLVKINCAAVPEALLEGELFGYERGAFTGAAGSKQGLVEASSSGTLLLDEIGDMALSTQAKLLHVVEQGEVTRLGAVKARKVDVRIVSATHRDLEAMVASGTFRADLYYRVNGISIPIPPLRERRSEILAFASSFLTATCARMRKPVPALSVGARRVLMEHPWPGNLRELRNVMDRAALLSQKRGEVTEEMLGLTALALPGTASPGKPPDAAPLPRSVHEATNLRRDVEAFERARIVEALAAADGNQARAAELLGLPLRTLVKRLSRYGLTRAKRPHE